ncbi:3'-5' exonuclease DinG [Candidatus Entotheonellaceae bacterium PAL068K]
MQQPAYVVVDVETTGFGKLDRIIEVAAVTLDPQTWEIVDEYDTLINPERDVGPTGVHGINAGMIEAAPLFSEIVAMLARRLHGKVFIAHNLHFDSRMLSYEFRHLGINANWGTGLCTLRHTGQNLRVACNQRGIELSHHHRALADARATATIARHLWSDQHVLSTNAIELGHVPHLPNPRTIRRGLVDDGITPMSRIVSLAHYPYCEEAVLHYLDALDWVLDDGVFDPDEQEKMNLLAEELCLSEQTRIDAHRDYLNCIIEAAKRDGVITAAERELILKIARQLSVDDADIPAITQMQSNCDLAPGTRVCFTGEAIINGKKFGREKLEAIALHHKLGTRSNVTKKGCDVLVAADSSSSSGKARKARQYGKPIMSVDEFLKRLSRRP